MVVWNRSLYLCSDSYVIDFPLLLYQKRHCQILAFSPWFLRCFWEDEAAGRVGAVILLLEGQTDGSNGFVPHGILLQFWVSRMKNERRRRRKLKKGELRRLRRKLRNGQRRHIAIHTVLQSWCYLRHSVTCYLLSNHQTELSLVQPCLLMECGTSCNTFLVARQARKLEEARAKEEVWMWRLQVVVVVVAGGGGTCIYCNWKFW